MFIFTNPAGKNANIRITVSTWLSIPFNKYLETVGTIVIHEKIAIVITGIVFLSLQIFCSQTLYSRYRASSAIADLSHVTLRLSFKVKCCRYTPTTASFAIIARC